jgi:Concanavalin A-like lectin/glucanases superfamily
MPLRPYGLYTGASGGLSFYVSDAAGFVLSPAALPARVWDGAWHHAVGTYDGRAVRLYLDGAQVGAGTATSLTIAYGAAASGVYLGSYRGSCVRPFTGDIDMVSIHPEALRAQQVGQSNTGVASRPLPRQVVPVSGPPARTPAASRKRCLTVRVTPKRLVKGRRSSLLIRVKRRGRPARGLRIAIRAPGVRRNVRTGRKGRARITVKPRRAGRLRVGATRQPAYCAPRVLKVARRR